MHTRYRWVVLAAFCAITAVMQLQWLTFAPIARQARAVYGVSGLAVDLLSLSFMLVFLVASIPVSRLIEARGVRFAVRLGAWMTAIFAAMKGFYAEHYGPVLVAQVGLALAQPFVLNATTQLASEWFPLEQRALAVGLATLSQFVGIVAVMIATPLWVQEAMNPTTGLQSALLGYAALTALVALATVALLRDAPRAPGAAAPARAPGLASFRWLLAQRDLRLTLIMFFLGLGMFNAISTCIDAICEQKGLDVEQAGLVGGIMLIAGIAGGLVLPLLSDRFRRRRAFLIACMACMLPGVIGLALFVDHALLGSSAALIGFFLLGGAAPIGFQYAAEVSHPLPESLAQGVILMSGQLSGIVFIVGMNLVGMLPSLWIHVAFAALILCTSVLLRESPALRVQRPIP
jgi:sugar phosphate permease